MIYQYQVYVDDQLVDIDDSFECPLTLQVFDITRLGAVSADYSKTIKIPKTYNNNKIFGFSNLVTSGSQIPYTKLPIRVIKGGIELISKGWCYVSGVGSLNYDLTIFYGNYDFFISLENKSLNELITTDIDHIINYLSIYNSSFGPGLFSKDYIYPLMEFGIDILVIPDDDDLYSPGKEFNLESMLPVISVKYLLNKIIEQAGYVCVDDSNLLDYFERKYIPLANLFGDDETIEQVCSAEATQETWRNVGLFPQAEPTWGALWFYVEPFTQNYFNQLRNIEHSESNLNKFTAYRVGCACSLQCTVTMQFAGFAFPYIGKVNVGIGVHDGKIYYEEDGTEYQNYVMIHTEEVTITTSDKDFWFTTKNDFVGKDFISVIVEIVEWPEGVARQVKINSAHITFDYPNDNVIQSTGYGYKLPIGKNLPDILQTDFIKGVFALRNVVLTTNHYDKIIYLNEFDKLYSNISSAKDWSSKVSDNHEDERVILIPDGFYKRNFMKYGNPDKTKNIEVGTGYFDIPNQNLESSDEFFKSIFDSVFPVERSIYRIPVLQIDFMDYFYVVSGSSPRILIVEDKLFDFPLVFISENQNVSEEHQRVPLSIFTSEKTYFDLLGTDDLHFQNIIDKYYSNLIELLQSFKMVECYVVLNDVDIANFNHLIPVWIDKYQSYFYVNRIIDYLGGLTKCELIKLY